MNITLQSWLACGAVVGLTACASAEGVPGVGGAAIENAGGTAGVGSSSTGGTSDSTPAPVPGDGTQPSDGSGGSPATGGPPGSVPPEAGGTPSFGGSGGSPPPAGTPDAGSASNGTPFPPVADFTSAGTFTPTSGEEGPQCTIFRPTVLGEEGRRHPVIVWGNGTFNTPANYTTLFNHFASQGFIVAAADTSNSGSGAEMIACLEYVLAQDGTSGSPYEGHVDKDHLASSGYSQGGAGCLMAGRDPRFTVTAAVSPFVVLPLGGYDPSAVAAQTHPMFMISGDADTVAVPSSNQQPIFQQAPVPIVWGTHAGSTHFEVLDTGGAYAGPLTAWFRYKLMNDASAGAWFETPPCTLCTTAGWTVQHNALWK